MDTAIERLGPCTVASPLSEMVFVNDDALVLYETDPACLTPNEPPVAFERAGPRRDLFFDPKSFHAGIVTCGGLCPGMNDTIRSIVFELVDRYGAPPPVGFRFGFRGLIPGNGHEPIELTPDVVDDIHNHGGTFLGSSRGDQDISAMVDTMERIGIQALFAIGGDGTQRAAALMADEVFKRGAKISIIGLPKTIDNDLAYITRSFGFITAVAAARPVIEAASIEAKGALNGIGVVKLMGRAAGWIAAYSTLANGDVNICLIPESPFRMDGHDGVLASVRRCLELEGRCLIVTAEGAGQELTPGEPDRDESGNLKLKDIGKYLCDQIKQYFAAENIEIHLKYIDPSYSIRGVAAGPSDSVFCQFLAQNAVHAAMSGRTNMLTGYWNEQYTYVPLRLVTSERHQVDPDSPLWQAVLSSTGQPPTMGYEPV